MCKITCCSEQRSCTCTERLSCKQVRETQRVQCAYKMEIEFIVSTGMEYTTRAQLAMRQRRQLPPHFSVQERAHALAISYKTSACMCEVNYISDRSLQHYKQRPHGQEKTSSIDNNFLYKAWKERQLRYFVHLRTFSKVRLVQLSYE